MTIEKWREILAPAVTPHGQAKLILKHINGYGTEYGYNIDTDANNLLNALEAMSWKPSK